MFPLSLLVLAGLAISGSATPIAARNHTKEAAPNYHKDSKRANLAQVYYSCTKPNAVALTFDDGPYQWHRQISDMFTAVGGKTTFFMNGYNWDCIYDKISDVQYAYNAGHMVADHTWSHGNLTTFSNDQIADGMYRMEEAFSRILGVLPAFVRPPYGDFNDAVRQVAYARNQAVIIWDQDSGDSDGYSTQQSEGTYANAVNAHPSNMLYLNHETYENTVDQILPYAINLLQNAGYELVTLADCLGMQPYYAVGVPQTNPNDGSWTCDNTPGPGEGCSGNCETGSVYLKQATTTTTSHTTTTTTSHTTTTTTTTTAPPTTTTTTTTTSTTTTTGPTPTGKSIRPGNAPNMCLTVANANSSPPSIQPCTGATNQQWSYAGPNQGTTITIYSGAQCLDVPSGNTTPGQKMQVYGCGPVNNANQQWWVTTDNRIAWENHGECLDLTNGVTTAGNVVQMWTCTNGNTNQVWNFV